MIAFAEEALDCWLLLVTFALALDTVDLHGFRIGELICSSALDPVLNLLGEGAVVGKEFL